MYKRQVLPANIGMCSVKVICNFKKHKSVEQVSGNGTKCSCLLYTSDAADERSSVDLGGRRIIKKKKKCT